MNEKAGFKIISKICEQMTYVTVRTISMIIISMITNQYWVNEYLLRYSLFLKFSHTCSMWYSCRAECSTIYKSISKRVFTRKILSQDETRPGMKSSLSMVKCLLLFTRLCWDKISSGMNSSLSKRQGWKKEKKTCKHFILEWNFKMSIPYGVYIYLYIYIYIYIYIYR